MNKPADSRINRCHVFVEQSPQAGTWNMAVDEAMLESAAQEGRCWLRWYRWAEPTVSLGYFQSDDIPQKLADLPVVRRLSGGGAILHHHELTYAAAIPAKHPLAAIPSNLYLAIHDQIISVISEHGIPATRRGTHAAFSDDSFLCFRRGDANDIVVQSHKILGSAQRRRRGAVLQHGSLLLKRSIFSEELPGLCDLGLDASACPALEASLTTAVSAVLGAAKPVDCLPESLLHVAEELERNRYSTQRTSTS